MSVEKRRTEIGGNYFVNEILEGRRDFPYVQLEEGFDFTGHKDFRKARECLASRKPFDISYSSFNRMVAVGLWMPLNTRGEEVEIVGSNLAGSMLNGAYLRKGKFNGSCLAYALLRETDFSGAEMVGTALYGANMQKAKLRGAILDGADLRRADLTKADLRNADLTSANLFGANLRDADLRGASVDVADFEAAYLRKADLRGVRNLDRALNLEHSVLSDVIVASNEELKTISSILTKAYLKAPSPEVDISVK